jgi:unsaturated rhamnogalacturonyl hydrolase
MLISGERIMRLPKLLATTLILGIGLTACALAQIAAPKPAAPQTLQATPAQKMAATVLQQHSASAATSATCTWGYEDGVRLDGMVAEWHNTYDPAYFAFIKSAVDPCIAADGAIVGYKPDTHTLDNIEMGRAILFLYRVTLDAKYARAAKFLHDQLDQQPRTASGGYWHKQVYPNQMWLDGAYMAEPFRAEYAVTFQSPADFDDIAKQLLLMDQHMRDPKTGLLRHGWDESKQMPWADKTTGLSPEVWGRAMGWYCMALVDVLDWFPKDHAQHAALVAALNSTMAAVLKVQDSKTGLWWEVMDKPSSSGPLMQKQPDGSIRVGVAKSDNGNYLEASASCMFAYALAKGARMGYLPQTDEAAARHAWDGIQKQFITANPDGTLILHGTVKVGGLGGTPYRAGDFAYYLKEAVVDQDAKGVGAFLLAGSEMDQPFDSAPGPAKKGLLLSSKDFRTSQEVSSRGKTALVDAWFNSQTRKNAFGQTEIFHYKWDDDSASGYSLFGRAFQSYGVSARHAARRTHRRRARARQDLRHRLARHPHPRTPTRTTMDKPSADAIEAWVRNPAASLMLFSNDRDNTEFDRLQHAQRPLRYPLQPGPLAPRRRRRPQPTGEVVIPRQHRHLRRGLHGIYEGHLLHQRSEARPRPSSPTTATS